MVYDSRILDIWLARVADLETFVHQIYIAEKLIVSAKSLGLSVRQAMAIILNQ